MTIFQINGACRLSQSSNRHLTLSTFGLPGDVRMLFCTSRHLTIQARQNSASAVCWWHCVISRYRHHQAPAACWWRFVISRFALVSVRDLRIVISRLCTQGLPALFLGGVPYHTAGVGPYRHLTHCTNALAIADREPQVHASSPARETQYSPINDRKCIFVISRLPQIHPDRL